MKAAAWTPCLSHSTLEKYAIYSSKASVDFQQTAAHHVPEDTTLGHFREMAPSLQSSGKQLLLADSFENKKKKKKKKENILHT
jgi:hypothetical protein